MSYSNLINANLHPNLFQNQNLEDNLLQEVDKDLFKRTNDSLDKERSKLVKGSTPKQQLIYDEGCKKDNRCQKLKMEKNITNKLFFSYENKLNLQNMIRYSVHKHSLFSIFI
jgi:hypothetical protein